MQNCDFFFFGLFKEHSFCNVEAWVNPMRHYVESELQCYTNSIFVGCLATLTTKSLIPQTPTGCPAIQLNSDTTQSYCQTPPA